MRIQLSRQISNINGPGIFTNRLMNCLVRDYGVKIVNKGADIFFCVIYVDDEIPTHARTVLRLDGLYWDAARFRKNKKIFQGIKRAHGVVFQSQFARNCYQAHLGNIENSTVILNGIDQSMINNMPVTEFPNGPGIVSCADWRPLKRPVSICRGYLESGVQEPLYMIGKIPQNAINHPKIFWIGQIDHTHVVSALKGNLYAIHLAKFDTCPNSVVEELCCGLPVLHTDNGGTPELVGGDGVCLNFDGGWNFRDLVSEDPDIIPASLVAEHIRKLVTMPKIGKRPDLEISSVAKKYYEYFKKVLGR